MSKHQVAVLKVVSKQSSITAAAAEYGISRGHLHRLLRRYRAGGLEALEPRSRRPHTSSQGTSDEVRGRIVALRIELTARGLDAGPVTIALIEIDKGYWRNTRRDPGRWPGSQKTS